MHNQRRPIKNRGETIVEVLIAVVISTMVLTATFALLNQSISTNVNVRNRVIALNIAREGVEAVRNIRDTNWLKYSGDRRGKWLCHDAVGANSCPGATVVQLGDRQYRVDYDQTNQRYYLIEGGEQAPLDLELVTDFSEYQLHYDEVADRYTHTANVNTRPTRFYRQIQLEVHDGDNTLPGGCLNAQCRERKLEIISMVQWKEEGGVRGSALEHHLYDFYERADYCAPLAAGC